VEFTLVEYLMSGVMAVFGHMADILLVGHALNRRKNMQDKRDHKVSLRAKQVSIGLGVGIIGMVTFSSLNSMDLYGDIMYSMVAGVLSMLVAIMIVTYRHDRQRKKRMKSK